ncbi:MAG: AbrB/MazE/SpoVT family DNA-binding domain-containing protein [Sphaerospermopsis sp. SIO1G2]|nr:AbrB/MazE/SpoVT family DNA-binding domain-containing protein [Sphaerospermopsis sp. SIO1G2]
MELSTLTSKGQFTIPVKLRKELELHAGDRLDCFIEDERLIVVPAKGSVKNLKGCVPKPAKPISIDDMNQALLDEAASHMGNSPS